MKIIGHPVEFDIAHEPPDAPEKRKPLTDEEISVMWHESGGQPFKFARMIEETVG